VTLEDPLPTLASQIRALLASGRAPATLLDLRRRAARAPGQPDLLLTLGGLYLAQGRTPEALELFGRIWQEPELRPQVLDLLAGLGCPADLDGFLSRLAGAGALTAAETMPLVRALVQQGTFLPAWELSARLAALEPESPSAWLGLGVAGLRLHRFEAAIAAFERAEALLPDPLLAQFGRSEALLLLGRLEEGLALRELRWRFSGLAPVHPELPPWDGSPLPGKRLLLHGTQSGAGDAVMAVRFATEARRRGAEVLVEADPGLCELLATHPDVQAVFPAGAPLPPVAAHADLMSLPFLLGLRRDTIPARVPYLSVPERVPRRVALDEALDGAGRRLKVGLVWAGNPNHEEDARRSLDPACLAPLAELCSHAAFFSLQKGQSGRPGLPPALEAVDLDPLLADFSSTAYALARLDLLVSADTSVVHVAGALGRPAWVLLAHLPDWRWFLETETTPWYPSLRLLRQQAPGDWQPVVGQVAARLAALAAGRPESRRNLGPGGAEG
jgi:hypothetical protein